MIRLTDITLARGTKILLRDASAVLYPNEKIGLVGSNGSGKSSLFDLLTGQLSLEAGTLEIPPRLRTVALAQEEEPLPRAIVDHVIDGDGPLRAIEAELAATELAHDSGDSEAGLRLALLHEQLGAADAYTARARAETLLTGLGFAREQLLAPVASLSGGWRKRLELGRALMAPSDLLLLDEPTNHLDLDAIVWLEQWLGRYSGTLVVVSHDREFLDAVCGVIIAIDDTTLRRYTGNYSSFEQQAGEARRQRQQAFVRQEREVEHLQRFIDRFRAKASKARQAQSRVKALERMQRIAPLHEGSPFSFSFREPLAVSDPLIRTDKLTCGYVVEDVARPIVSNATLTIGLGERIGLLGANGQGKSTLIKTLAGTLPALAGEVTRARNLAIGYFAQQQVDMLRGDESPLRQLARLAPDTREQELRNYLGGFDFRGDVVNAPVAPFSGGEKARLALALIIWQRPNLLLLDEPTNHLDLETREALSLALAQFEGTLVLVSHDRALLASSVDRLLVVTHGRLQEFEGDLEDYRRYLLSLATGAAGFAAPAGSSAASSVQPSAQSSAQSSAPSSSQSPKASPTGGSAPLRASERAGPQARSERRAQAEERARQSQTRRPIESRIQRIESQLEKLNAQRAAIEASLADSSAYEPEQRDRLREWVIEQAYTAREIERLEHEWLEQHALLEQLES